MRKKARSLRFLTKSQKGPESAIACFPSSIFFFLDLEHLVEHHEEDVSLLLGARGPLEMPNPVAQNSGDEMLKRMKTW